MFKLINIFFSQVLPDVSDALPRRLRARDRRRGRHHVRVMNNKFKIQKKLK